MVPASVPSSDNPTISPHFLFWSRESGGSPAPMPPGRLPLASAGCCTLPSGSTPLLESALSASASRLLLSPSSRLYTVYALR